MLSRHVDEAQLVDVWVLSSLWLLGRGLLRTLLYRSLSEHTVSFLLSGYPRVELLSGTISVMLNFVRSCISLIIECVAHIFMYYFFLCIFLGAQFSSSDIFLSFFFMLNWVVKILFVLGIWVPVGCVCCECFLPVCALPFIFVVVSLDKQRFLILAKSNLSIKIQKYLVSY